MTVENTRTPPSIYLGLQTLGMNAGVLASGTVQGGVHAVRGVLDQCESFFVRAHVAGELMRDALAATGCEIVTVALRRADLSGKKDPFANILEFIPQDRYLLLPHGASMGDRYGPVVVARKDGPKSCHLNSATL